MATPTLADLPGTAINVGGVLLKTRLDPFDGGIDRQNRPWRTVAYLCDGPDVDEACDALKGIGSYASVPFGYPLPHRYPKNPNLICESVTFALKGARRPGPKLLTAPFAEIRATYGVPEFDVYGDDVAQSFVDEPIPFANYQVRGGLEVFPWPSGSDFAAGIFVFEMGSDGAGITPDVKAIKYRMPTKDYVIRRAMIPNFRTFDVLLTNLMGTINLNPMWGFAKGQFLIDPHDYDPNYDPSGKRMGEFALIFRWRAQDWNMEPVPGKFGKFARVEDPDGNRNYLYADWSALLTYGL